MKIQKLELLRWVRITKKKLILCQLAQPTWTDHQLRQAHLEGFGSIQGVIKGKSELYEYLSNTGGTIFEH